MNNTHYIKTFLQINKGLKLLFNSFNIEKEKKLSKK